MNCSDVILHHPNKKKLLPVRATSKITKNDSVYTVVFQFGYAGLPEQVIIVIAVIDLSFQEFLGGKN